MNQNGHSTHTPGDSSPQRPLIHTAQLLAIMRAESPSGARTLHDLEYVKRNGERVRFDQAQYLAFHKPTQTLTIKLPGGVRTVRLWALVGFDGHEVFI